MRSLAVKAIAFVMRQRVIGLPQILVYRWRDAPELPWRIPGGTVKAAESPKEAVLRELAEEVGEYSFAIIRQLGIQRYYKAFIARDVERHDFLVIGDTGIPDAFLHVDPDITAGEPNVMELKWVTAEALHEIDPEHAEAITETYIPELFEGKG